MHDGMHVSRPYARVTSIYPTRKQQLGNFGTHTHVDIIVRQPDTNQTQFVP